MIKKLIPLPIENKHSASTAIRKSLNPNVYIFLQFAEGISLTANVRI
ncbi:hypothetical protein HMPREF0208_01872 [Citrobacter koseri]|nr:hypothetical protein HMPREF3220_03667 [Citrobacter koseri]KXA00974.1 hypothetical protein HMPREF3207_03167 [Citrobacter koseri]KXB44521.1 hypothetical protein HMPREF0208_01872 [Citrobacter koseri]